MFLLRIISPNRKSFFKGNYLTCVVEHIKQSVIACVRPIKQFFSMKSTDFRKLIVRPKVGRLSYVNTTYI